MLLANKLLTTDGAVVDKKIEKVEKHDKELAQLDKKNTDRLVKSVTGLTNQLVKIEKDAKKNNGRLTLGGLFGQAKDTFKKFTSLGGIAGHIADKADNKLVKATAGSLANMFDSKKEKKQKQEQFVSTVMKGTAFGRKYTEEIEGESKKDQKAREVKGVKAVAKLYAAKTERETELSGLKAKQQSIKELGKEAGVETNLDDKDLERMEELEKQLLKIVKSLESGKKEVEKEDTLEEKNTPLDDKTKEDLIEATKEGIVAGYEALSPEEKEALDKADPEFVSSAIAGALDELNNISKEQLYKLIAIQRTLEGSEEDKMEEKIKDSMPAAKKEEKKEEKSEGFFQKMIKFGMDLFKNPLGTLTSLLGSIPKLLMQAFTPLVSMLGGLVSSAVGALAPLAGPLAAVAAAGAAGWFAGNKLNDMIEEKTGDTVGNHAYKAVDWVKGAIGMETDDDKIKNAEEKAAIDLGKKKLASGEKMSTMLAEKLKKNGIEVPESQIIKPGEVIKSPPSAQPISDETKNASAELQYGMDTGAKIEKSADTASNQLRQVDNDLEKQEAEKEKKKVEAVNIVNAPKTINNNSTVNQTVVPKTRNDEMTYMK